MSHEYLNQQDFFLLNPPSQPKAEIANYVESCDILVPKRYVNLDEALASGKPFIIRSEHPQDYAGASGLFESIEINKKVVAEAQKESMKPEPNRTYSIYVQPEVEKDVRLYDHILATINNSPQEEVEKNIIELSRWGIKQYCRLTNSDKEAFEKQITFSYWKLVKGIRQTVVADSAIKGRYHIFSEYPHFNYCIYENGAETLNFLGKTMTYAEEAVKLYEKVRKLPQFDESNVPSIEMVSKNGRTYFLQYLRGRQFSPPSFSLEDRKLESGEVEAQWIRGKTPPEGVICDTKFWYKNQAFDEKLQDEEASFDFHFNWLFSELMTPRRRIQFMRTAFMNVIEKRHLPKSKLFRPQVSIFLRENEFSLLMPEFGKPNDHIQPKDLGVKDYEDFRVKLQIIADGRRAIIKRVS